MDFRIADTFTASLTKLTVDEQKLVKQTAFDAQVNPASPGLRFHKLDRSRDRNFWSLSVAWISASSSTKRREALRDHHFPIAAPR